MRTAIVLSIGLGLMCASVNAHAQSLSFASKDPDKPIEVTADQGIEWQQSAKLFIARGNAKARQGELSVTADELVAHYRDTNSGNEVYRVDAVGNVAIASTSEQATGSAAVYDFDKSVLVIEGNPVSLTTPSGKVTAKQAIQYWARERVAVAEGDAEAQDENRRIKADRLTAFFHDVEKAKTPSTPTTLQQGDIRIVQAEGNVVMRTAKETVRGDRGEYNRDTGIARLEGAVKMTQGENQLSGGFAVVDTKAGTSRLFGSAREAGVPGPGSDARVKALIAPKPKSPDAKAPEPAK
ncbi:MAG: LptA/OstA family protein [Rhodospirillaceae bacterium]|nr:LptA/OstA family protein [Rhodospirillaceae bacterium]